MNEIIRKAFIWTGLGRMSRQLNKFPRVLFYHSVDDCFDDMVGMFTTPVHEFEKEIKWLNKEFEIISVEEFDERYQHNNFTGREVVLTFDDGFKNALTIVEPMLSSMGLPFTVFISTDHIESGTYFPTTINRMVFYHGGLNKIKIPTIGKEYQITSEEERFSSLMEVAVALKTSPSSKVKRIVEDLKNNFTTDDWDELCAKFPSEQPLTWNEVKELSDRGVTIGGHCKEHISLVDSVPSSIIEKEIIGSRIVIEEKLNKRCNYFAYPSGHVSETAIKCVADNYSMGFTTCAEEKMTTSVQRGLIPRIPVGKTFLDLQINFSKYPDIWKKRV